jgi:hypothetical protein
MYFSRQNKIKTRSCRSDFLVSSHSPLYKFLKTEET